jgi:hypothetical protein
LKGWVINRLFNKLNYKTSIYTHIDISKAQPKIVESKIHISLRGHLCFIKLYYNSKWLKMYHSRNINLYTIITVYHFGNKFQEIMQQHYPSAPAVQHSTQGNYLVLHSWELGPQPNWCHCKRQAEVVEICIQFNRQLWLHR